MGFKGSKKGTREYDAELDAVLDHAEDEFAGPRRKNKGKGCNKSSYNA